MSKPEQYQKDDARQGQSPRGEEDDPRWAPPQEKPRAPRGENQGRSPRGEHPTQGPRQGEAED